MEAAFPRLIELQLRNLNVNHALMLAPWVTAAQAVRVSPVDALLLGLTRSCRVSAASPRACQNAVLKLSCLSLRSLLCPVR